MTERNLVDDLPKMSDTSHLDFQTPRIVCADGAVPRIALALRPGKTVSYYGQRYRVVGLDVNTGGYHGTTIGR